MNHFFTAFLLFLYSPENFSNDDKLPAAVSFRAGLHAVMEAKVFTAH